MRFKSVLKVDAPADVDIISLKESVRTAFASDFIDFNETEDGSSVSVYLKNGNPGDQGKLEAVVRAHNSAIERQNRKDSQDAEKAEMIQLMDAVGIPAEKRKLFIRLVQKINSGSLII